MSGRRRRASRGAAAAARSPRASAPFAADPRLDGSEEARPASCRRQDCEEQERGRRLPARTGHADHLELLGRPLEELVRRDRHRGARVGHDDLRHGGVRSGKLERPLDDERHGAALHRVCRELVPVGPRPRHAEEHRSRRDRPRVIGEVANLDRSPPDDLGRAECGDEALQIHHRRPSLPPAVVGSGVLQLVRRAVPARCFTATACRAEPRSATFDSYVANPPQAPAASMRWSARAGGGRTARAATAARAREVRPPPDLSPYGKVFLGHTAGRRKR
jgi:hypothetical protein